MVDGREHLECLHEVDAGHSSEPHKYLIEPLSDTKHIKTILIKRFLSFLDQIRKSNKCATKFLLNSILLDARSTTGSNLRNILLRTDKTCIDDLNPNDAFQIEYHPIKPEETWRLPYINDIIEIKNEQMMIPNISEGDVDDMLNVLCTS